MAKKAKVDLSAELQAAYREYDAAYREYEAATRMDVPTPEGVGTFGGVWDCDESRLLRALVLAIRRTQGVCSIAAEKAAKGEAVRVTDGGYGDVYRMPNGMLRDPDGRYLTSTESAIITRALRGRTDEGYTAGRLTQGWIDEQAGDQIARTLTKSYLVGWPVCTDQQKLDAYRRVRDIYRTLAAAIRDAE